MIQLQRSDHVESEAENSRGIPNYSGMFWPGAALRHRRLIVPGRHSPIYSLPGRNQNRSTIDRFNRKGGQ